MGEGSVDAVTALEYGCVHATEEERMASRTTADGRPWIFTQSFASVYPHYVEKAEKKGRTKDEVDQIIRWLTGYTPKTDVREGIKQFVAWYRDYYQI